MRITYRPVRIGEPLDDRDEVEEAVGHVKGDDAAGLHVPPVDASASEVMRWTGIASLENASTDEHVELLLRLALERQPRIAEGDSIVASLSWR